MLSVFGVKIGYRVLWAMIGFISRQSGPLAGKVEVQDSIAFLKT